MDKNSISQSVLHINHDPLGVERLPWPIAVSVLTVNADTIGKKVARLPWFVF